MKKKIPPTIKVSMLLCVLMLTVTTAAIKVASPNPKPTVNGDPTTVSVYPTSITGPPPSIGETFTIYINIENVTDLYSYAIAWSWNTTVLECLSWTFNYTFFPADLTMAGVIDNVAGRTTTPFGATLTDPPHATGVTGSGTLADLEFKVIRGGTSWINFTRCELLSSSGSDISRDLINGTFQLSLRSPKAVKTHTPITPYVNETITFNTSASEPGFNGTHYVPITSYTWNFGDTNVTTTTNSVITHSYSAAGTYIVNLTVTCQDSTLIAEGLESNSTWQNVTVLPIPPPIPTVSIYPSGIIGPPPSIGENFTVNINVENVTDLYSWEIGVAWNSSILECLNFTVDYSFFGPEGYTMVMNGTIDNITGIIYPAYACSLFYPAEVGVNGSGTLANVTFRVKEYGACEITLNHTYRIPWMTEYPGLRILNHLGNEISFNLVEGYFELAPPPEAPVARFNYSPPSPNVGEKVTFNASASLPGWNGTATIPIANYTWDFGDGNTTTATNLIIVHAYTSDGTYTVTLNITDTEGLWNTTSQNITISAVHDVAVTSLTPSPTEVTVGESVSITVVVKNEGDMKETFDVTVFYDTTEIDTQAVTDLATGAEKTLTFTWNTTGVEARNYTVKAVAQSVTGETDTDDNTFIDGTVIVKEAPKPAGIPWIWIIAAIVVVTIIVVVYRVMRRKPK